MKRIKLALALVTVLFHQMAFSQADYSTFSPLEHVAANLLIISGSSDHTKTGAKILYAKIDPNQVELFDLAALKLTRLGTTYPDTTAWLLKAMARVPTQRYLAFLSNLQKEFRLKSDNQEHDDSEISEARNYKNRHVLKNIRKAISKIKKHSTTENIFSIDRIDFEQTYDTILATNSNQTKRDRNIDSPDIGQNLSQLYSAMGPPNSIDLWGKHVKLVIPIGVYGSHDASFLINNFNLTYEDFARYDFHLDRNKNEYTIKKIKRIRAEEIAAPNWVPPDYYGEILKTVPSTLMPADGQQTLELAKVLIHKKNYRQDYLDLAAEKLWRERKTSDREMINGIAHLARYIGESDNGRYANILQETLNDTNEKKLKKHVKRALKRAQENIEDTQQYSPES
ncbi:MAG: hypothetical protein ACRBBR_15510 [Cellvibrionaceae bacterium]